MVTVQGRIVPGSGKDGDLWRVVFNHPLTKEEMHFNIPHGGIHVLWRVGDFYVEAGDPSHPLHNNEMALETRPGGTTEWRQKNLHRCTEACPK